jgi:Lar family restriction alleviation protein
MKDPKPITLKPCPFCGSDRVQLLTYYDSFVRCCVCLANSPPARRQDTAVRRWNRRAT